MKNKKNYDTIHLFVQFFYVVLFAFLMLGRFSCGRHIRLATDPVIVGYGTPVGAILQGIIHPWNSYTLLGDAYSSGFPTIASLFNLFLPPIIGNNWIYMLACIIASMVFISHLNKSHSFPAIATGALAAFWLGSNFTLSYAGHDFKPYVVLFFVCAVCAAKVPGWIGGIIWGGFAGLMVAQQPDVGLIFGIFAGLHLLFSIWQAHAFRWKPYIIRLAPAFMIAFLIAAQPLLGGYRFAVEDAAPMQTENPQEKWEYVTQWSMPPEEVIDFIAPNFTGIRSHEPEGPYWGRMGRSAGWEERGQGFMNFRLESLYLGFIPIAFALFALFSCRRSRYRAEILFWGGAAAIALLLSFGKHFPLYSLFYQLPVVNNIRNPNKFLQVLQVCIAILTAYGFDALWRSREKNTGDLKPKAKNPKPESADVSPPCPAVRQFFWLVASATGLLVLWALALTLNRSADVSRFIADEWPRDLAAVITQNRIAALWHAGFMAAVVTAVFALFSFPRFARVLRYRNWIAAGIVLLVAADAVKLSRHYVKEMPRSYIESNALTDFLQENSGHGRVALASQEGIYGIWVTYLLPYNRIPTFNFSDMPRLATDYLTFLQAGQRNPLAMWCFSGVRFLLAPAELEERLAGQARKVFAYHVAPAGGSEIRVIEHPDGAHAVFELLHSVPRYVLLAGFDPERDADALDRMVGGGPLLNGRPVGSVEVVRYRPGRVELRTNADEPTMLRVAERWDRDWKASVNGKPHPVQRIDFLCQGVDLPAGTHTVVLRYAPTRLFFYMQLAGYAILLGALVARVITRSARSRSTRM